jgi:hypothetical protein
VTYWGPRDPKALGAAFQRMHIIVSPVRSHVLYHGNFDGFPTATALHASMSGCAVITTDPHDNAERLELQPGLDLILTSDRPSEIAHHIETLRTNRTALYELALRGSTRFGALLQLEKLKADKACILEGLMHEGRG